MDDPANSCAALWGGKPLEASWADALRSVLCTDRTARLCAYLDAERARGHTILPPPPQWFAVFAHTPLPRARVVIVGQDPYHGPGQAIGLAFAVARGTAIPPSLRNIFTELVADLGIERPAHGDLTAWADRGVLLLNTALTVRANTPASHARAGWQPITDAAIRAVSDTNEHVVFLLWGRHAQARAALIDPDRHLVLRAAHPSPLSASRGFFGCRHFSQANTYLREHGHDPIDWTLPA